MTDKPQLKMELFFFVFVFSLNKAAGFGGRWEHVLWACEGGRLFAEG